MKDAGRSLTATRGFNGTTNSSHDAGATIRHMFIAKDAQAAIRPMAFEESYKTYSNSNGVVNLPGGRPTMTLTGGAAARLAALVPQGHEARIDVSITDEYPLAQAFVVISAVPATTPG